jgi:hypothetical protein
MPPHTRGGMEDVHDDRHGSRPRDHCIRGACADATGFVRCPGSLGESDGPLRSGGIRVPESSCPSVVDLREPVPWEAGSSLPCPRPDPAGTRATAATPSMPPTPRETVALRLGLLDLVRLVLDDSWTLERSAEQLRAHVRSERALRTLRARVWRVGQERSTPTGERMLATIEAALVLDGQQDRPAVGPSSGVRVRS